MGYKNLDHTFAPTFQDESQLPTFRVANCDAIGENSRTVCKGIVQIIHMHFKPLQGPRDKILYYLEVEFRCHSHKQVHIQIIMMGDKWFGRRPTCYHIHHGGFNLLIIRRKNLNVVKISWKLILYCCTEPSVQTWRLASLCFSVISSITVLYQFRTDMKFLFTFKLSTLYYCLCKCFSDASSLNTTHTY